MSLLSIIIAWRIFLNLRERWCHPSKKENPERMKILVFPVQPTVCHVTLFQDKENADKLSLPAQPVSSTSPRHVGNSFLARIHGQQKFMTASAMILTRKTETKKRISICIVCIDTLDFLVIHVDILYVVIYRFGRDPYILHNPTKWRSVCTRFPRFKQDIPNIEAALRTQRWHTSSLYTWS